MQDLQAVSQASLSQVYSSLIPQVAFQISFPSITASAAQASQVQPQADVHLACAPGSRPSACKQHLHTSRLLYEYASIRLMQGCSYQGRYALYPGMWCGAISRPYVRQHHASSDAIVSCMGMSEWITSCRELPCSAAAGFSELGVE